MTQEEKDRIEARLRKAKFIEEKIETLNNGLSIFDSGKIYLNACTYQKEHEEMSRALGLVESFVREVFSKKIEELKKEFEAL